MPSMRPLFLLTAISLALLRAKRKSRLRLYLWSELITTAGIEAALWHWPDVNSRGYTVTYVLARPLELAAAIYLARPRTGFILASFLLACVAFIGTQSLSLNSVITLLEGGAFILAAMGMAMQPIQVWSAALAILWAMLAMFDFGYAMGWQLPAWQGINLWWPSMACIVAFLVVAIFPNDTSRSL